MMVSLFLERLRRGPPIHQFAIVELGLPLVDVMDFEAAAETAARLKRPEFLVTTLAVPVPGGTGFPLNPSSHNSLFFFRSLVRVFPTHFAADVYRRCIRRTLLLLPSRMRRRGTPPGNG